MEGQGAVGRAYLPVALLDLADPPSEPSLNETMDTIKEPEVKAQSKAKPHIYMHRQRRSGVPLPMGCVEITTLPLTKIFSNLILVSYCSILETKHLGRG